MSDMGLLSQSDFDDVKRELRQKIWLRNRDFFVRRLMEEFLSSLKESGSVSEKDLETITKKVRGLINLALLVPSSLE